MEEEVISDVRRLEIKNTSRELPLPCCPTIEIAGPQSDDLSERNNKSTTKPKAQQIYLHSQRRQQSHDEIAVSRGKNEDEFPRLPHRRHIQLLKHSSVCTSFDIDRRPSSEIQSVQSGENRWSNLVLHHIPDRRCSFLYRRESDDNYSLYSSRHPSITGEEAHVERRPLRTDKQEVKSVFSTDNEKADNSKKGSEEPILNGGQLQTQRLSLPDVIMPSTNQLAVKQDNIQRPSLQIDVETGRRSTLDVETTARLAEAESIGFDDAFGLSRTPLLVGTGIKAVTARSFSLSIPRACSPRKLGKVSTNVSSRNTSMNMQSTVRKNSTLTRLLSLRSLRTQIGRKDMLKCKDSKRGSYDSTRSKKSTKAINKTGCFRQQSHEDDDQSTDQEGSTDKLGQLPSTNQSALGRFKESEMLNYEKNMNEFMSNPTLSFERLCGRNTTALRRGSLCIFSHVDEPIVTPFAQILASLRHVRANFILLTNITSSKDSRFGTPHTNFTDGGQIMALIQEEQLKVSASETLEELEWCLERLENIQTHRSVSDMATSKFRKMLNKELSQFKDGCQNAKQISEYICSTFLDPNEVDPNSAITHLPDKASNENLSRDSSKATNVTQKTSNSTEVRVCGASFLNIADTEGPKAADEHQWLQKANTESSQSCDRVTPTSALSLDVLPPGLKSDQMARLKQFVVTGLDQWGVDIFELSQLTSNPLTCLFYAIFQKRGLIKRFSIPEMNLVRYANLIEEKYNDVPYHNRVHAADVLQSTHVLLNASALTSVFTDLEVMAVLFACAIHDVDHPGLTNQFLINTNDELAILYNDTSVLENHHLAVGFQLLTRPGCDILENVPKKQRLSLRRMVIDMVLATDMSKHMSLLADLKTMVETKKVAGSGILTLDNYSDRMQILQNMIHCADLSNPTKSLKLYRQWNARIMEEHFRQGDRERERGLDLSPMCDRTTASIEKTQVSFIDYIVHPLWETWSDLVHPDALQILDTLDENREWYLNQITKETVSEDSEPPEDKQ